MRGVGFQNLVKILVEVGQLASKSKFEVTDILPHPTTQNLPEVLINSNAMENYNVIEKELLDDICNFLEPFQDVINALSKDRQPCLHRLMPHGQCLVEHCHKKETDSSVIMQLKSFLARRIKNAWYINDYHRLATILHPKLKNFEFCRDEKERSIDVLKQEYDKLELNNSLTQKIASNVLQNNNANPSQTSTTKLKEILPLPNAPDQGRKKASTPIDDRNLLQLCKKYRTKSSQILSSELMLSNGKHLSARTKPLRTPAHKKQRFLFAREHQYWSQEQNNIIWSDEAHFEVLNRKNRTFVRRLRSEADQPFNFVPKVQDGGGSISVWECMASGARGPLVTYSGKVDGRAYVKIIEEALPSFIENAFDSSNKNWMFMRDNAPPHRSKYTMKWLQDKGIKVMEWPVTSPRS
ncbi:unnamed protein product [Rotaria socialis]